MGAARFDNPWKTNGGKPLFLTSGSATGARAETGPAPASNPKSSLSENVSVKRKSLSLLSQCHIANGSDPDLGRFYRASKQTRGIVPS
jgi:hypothetical protein